jgi:uncharacterized protein YbjT (DUF2867 family)
MNILLAGAAGQLGQALVVALCANGHTLTAIDANIAPLAPYKEMLARIEQVDLQQPAALSDLCTGMDSVITTVGIGRPQHISDYERVDYGGNLNLLRAAQNAGVRRFVYTSIHQVDSDPSVPMLKAKAKMEAEVKRSGLDWLIIRPCGYFTDIWRTFMKSAAAGKMTLVGKNNPAKFNPIHPADLAEWIAGHLDASGQIQSIGGPEDFTYREITELCFSLLDKPAGISEMSVASFDVFLGVMHLVKPQTWAVMRFLRWASTTDLSTPHIGQRRLKDYLQQRLAEETIEKKEA